MPLEATVVVVDVSEYARDGDYGNTSRLKVQQEAANMIAGMKTNANPESGVGVLAMRGGTSEVRLSITTDLGKILSSVGGLTIPVEDVNTSTSSSLGNFQVVEEKTDLIKALNTALLVLKHRLNKNQKQRIVMFLTSPLLNSISSMETTGKLLKKNAVAIDLISIADFPNDTDYQHKLNALVNAAGGEASGCHLVVLTAQLANGRLLSDLLVSTPVFATDGLAAGGGAFEFGVDANLDPELAMALRLSMEEENARLARETSPAPAAGAGATEAPVIERVGLPGETMADTLDDAIMEEDEEMMDEELRAALEESMTDWQQQAAGAGDGGEAAEEEAFVAELLAAMPGVDRSDPRIQEALRVMREERRNRK